jgi:hypothetical protein
MYERVPTEPDENGFYEYKEQFIEGSQTDDAFDEARYSFMATNSDIYYKGEQKSKGNYDIF